jgi:hypothetical protein
MLNLFCDELEEEETLAAHSRQNFICNHHHDDIFLIRQNHGQKERRKWATFC